MKLNVIASKAATVPYSSCDNTHSVCSKIQAEPFGS